jgi:hypothetical protein
VVSDFTSWVKGSGGCWLVWKLDVLGARYNVGSLRFVGHRRF